MKLKILGKNLTLLITNHGDEVLYSYEVPVAGFNPALGHWRTSEHYSVTSTKHMNNYLKDVDNVVTLTPEQIKRMF